ncbi:hypothetical protein YTPLAS18_12410 [Nitrospira sp.]|nr:hypothetical protein YTPLAS18_12410 [Nitrospira sp.]
MLRFLGLLVLLIMAFGLGYVTGQLPLHPLTEKVRELSRNVLDTTLGMEHNLRRRKGLLDAKGHLVDAKMHVMDRNYGSASREMAEVVDALEQAIQGTRDAAGAARMRSIVGEVREARLELSMGKRLPHGRIDTLQREVDDLLSD